MKHALDVECVVVLLALSAHRVVLAGELVGAFVMPHGESAISISLASC